MLASLIRKLNQLAEDPVLRRWLLGRIIGHWRSQSMARSLPPYLDGIPFNAKSCPRLGSRELRDARPTTPLEIHLAGFSQKVLPGDEDDLVSHIFQDIESLLALHRFCWWPHCVGEDTASWVNVIFDSWVRRFGDDRDSWAWHPYTVAERLVNLIRFAQVHGLPGEKAETLTFLSHHGAAIFSHLEYFGENNTGNHLANNGRGLFLGGLELGLDQWADVGGRILIEEGRRIFTSNGLLREGSSHYHLLVTRWYAECWLTARKFGRPEAAALEEIAGRSLSVSPLFDLPGGLPLVGDISPDCPPAYLAGLTSGEPLGWLGTLPAGDRRLLSDLMAENLSENLAKNFAKDGWFRRDYGPWSLLLHASPEGWSFLPGHGHRDFGGFELHADGLPLLCDLGRRSYGPSGGGDVAATMHNTIIIDENEPYPMNRPYYDARFRNYIAGPNPEVLLTADGVSLQTRAFARLRGVTTWNRTWRLTENAVSVTDRIDGNGRHRIERYLHTAQPVGQADDGYRLGSVRLSANGKINRRPSKRWTSYGMNEPATAIVISNDVELPWSSSILLERAPE